MPVPEPPRRPRPGALRRPTVRAASVAALTVGIALFVVASAVEPLAGADRADGAARPGADRASGAHRHDVVRDDPTVPTAPSASATTPTPSRPSPTPTRSPRPAPVDDTVISGLAANGIPSVALNAYRVAAARMANADPSCGLRWPLIAGIGREESDHGRFAGAVLHADGISTPAIVGPALNGRAGNRFIPAPADGLALDGDATYAHALGPMQFIPSTWAIYGVDGDGDGRADIFDINDAALATARYLCAAGGDLGTHAGRVRAVFAYNNTDVYVAQVLALAQAYRTGTTVTGIPHGDTTGALPTLGTSGTVPPANPGAPTANRARRKAAQRKAAELRRAERRRAEQRRRAERRRQRVRLGGGSPTPTRTTHPPSLDPTPSPGRSGASSSPTCVSVCLP